MKKYWIIPAALLAMALVITGCPKTTDPPYYPPENINWSITQDGTVDPDTGLGTKTTENIIITFDQDIDTSPNIANLTVSGAADRIAGASGQLVKNSDREWKIPVTVNSPGIATVTITQTSTWKFGMAKSETITVYVENEAVPILWEAEADGEEDNETSTIITFTFDEDVSNLTANDITIIPSTVATKGTLSMTDGNAQEWVLGITVSSQGTLAVSITKDGIDGASQQVPVYKKVLTEDDYDITELEALVSEPEDNDSAGRITGEDFIKVKEANRGSYLLLTIDLSGHSNASAGPGWGIGAVGNVKNAEGNFDGGLNLSYKWPAGAAKGIVEVKIDTKEALEYVDDADDFLYVNIWDNCIIQSIKLYEKKEADPEPDPLPDNVYRIIPGSAVPPVGSGNSQAALPAPDVAFIAEMNDDDVIKFYFSGVVAGTNNGRIGPGWSGGFVFNTDVTGLGTAGELVYAQSVGNMKAWWAAASAGAEWAASDGLVVQVYNSITLVKIELCEPETVDDYPPPPPPARDIEGNLGNFNETNNANQRGWNLNWSLFKDSKYLVLETEAAEANTFGGISIVLQGDHDGWEWDSGQTDINGNYTSFDRSGTESVYIVVDLETLTSYDDFIAGTQGKLMVCYYSDDVDDLGILSASLTDVDLAKPAGAVDLENDGTTYGFVGKDLDFTPVEPPEFPVLYENGVWGNKPGTSALGPDSWNNEKWVIDWEDGANAVNASGYDTIVVEYTAGNNASGYFSCYVGGFEGTGWDWTDIHKNGEPGTVDGQKASMLLTGDGGQGNPAVPGTYTIQRIQKLELADGNTGAFDFTKVAKIYLEKGEPAEPVELPDGVLALGVETADTTDDLGDDWSVGFTTGGGQAYQRGWEFDGEFFETYGIPTHIVLQSAGGGDGLGGIAVILQPGWVQTNDVTPGWSFDGDWASTPTTIIIDLRECNSYDTIFTDDPLVDWAQIVLSLPQAHQFVAGSSLIGAFLIFDADLGDAIVADGTNVYGANTSDYAWFIKDFDWADYDE